VYEDAVLKSSPDLAMIRPRCFAYAALKLFVTGEEVAGANEKRNEGGGQLKAQVAELGDRWQNYLCDLPHGERDVPRVLVTTLG
jgi:hypothetical protein